MVLFGCVICVLIVVGKLKFMVFKLLEVMKFFG